MAVSILRLKVESQEYDQKIKRAAEGIQQYAQKCREVGGTLEHLDDGVLEFVQALGKMDTVATSSKQQLREMSNALTTLTTTYRELTDEEKSSPFGQELAKGIQQLTERAGQAQDAMADVQASIRNAASDTRLFDQLSQGMSVATAGFQGLTGAGKLLGIEMGNDVEVIAKLQAAMAVTNSLTTIQTALQKQSALMQGVQAAQTALATAAQTAFGAATGSATAAQAAFNAVANMNPYVALATAIAAVGTALWAFSSASSEAKKREEELEKAEEEATKKAQEQRDAFVNASASAMNTASRISSLQVAYKQANTEMEKTSILKQAQSEFKKLGIECNGVYDAQTLLLKEGGKIIEMIRLQGNVAAISAMRMEAFKESFKKMMENGYSASTAAILAGANQQVVDLDNQINKMQGRINDIKGTLPTTSGSSTRGSGTTNKTITEADEQALNSQKITSLTNEYVKASDDRRVAIEKEIATLKRRNEEIQKLKDMAQGKFSDVGNIGEVVVKGDIVKSIDRQFREAATNLDAVNEYMNGIKSAIKNADLGSATWESLTDKMRDATSMSSLIQEAIRAGVDGAELDEMATTLKDKLLDGDIPDETIQAFIDRLNEKIEETDGVKLKLNAETGEVSQDKEKKQQQQDEMKTTLDVLKDEVNKASTAIGGLSQINTGLKGLGINLGKGVDEALNVAGSFIQVLNGLQSFLSVFQTSALASNTIALNANTAALGLSSATGTTTGAIGGALAGASSVLGPVAIGATALFAAGKIFDWFSGGGVIGHAAMGLSIPGNSFSGDNLRMPVVGGGHIALNSGELILNRAQQGVLASELSEPGMQNVRMSAVIEGEDIILATDNYYDRWSSGGERVSSR